MSEHGRPEEVFVRQNYANVSAHTLYPHHFFRLRQLYCTAHINDLSVYRVVDAKYAEQPKEQQHFPRVPLQERWGPWPGIFQIDKRPGALTVILKIARQSDQESFLLMLGSILEFETGFDACGYALDSDVQQMLPRFWPRPNGISALLQFHHIRVMLQERIGAGQKMYFVDVEIEPIAKSSTVLEALHDVVETLAMPINDANPSRAGRIRPRKKALRLPWLR